MCAVRLSRHRLLALFCGVLAALTLTTPAIAAPPQFGVVRSDAAAGWLARQLVDGERFEAVFDGVAYPDQGLTLDAVFAFAAGGVADDFGAQALAWATRPDVRDGYIGDGTTEAYAGATAKLALAVAVHGGDPTDVGGVGLIARLDLLQAPPAAGLPTGRRGVISATRSVSPPRFPRWTVPRKVCRRPLPDG
ncbi:hypothetical protein [Verrucosispora sp. WMMD573]|uniref:hypothetical protein n=1 Tax=Verrucosispora sp. WMMD573 TaxID=3015149 RepID=UPI00248D335B|nr:hypothetical protein [Verrucosispora sp. WMMD573]WBB54686.1 hypothetical protein O7601_00650 [Verrucosispora sp. WMMD573]